MRRESEPFVTLLSQVEMQPPRRHLCMSMFVELEALLYILVVKVVNTHLPQKRTAQLKNKLPTRGGHIAWMKNPS